MMDSPTASVVIPTRNRPQALEHCLDALAEQTLPPGSFEVIVVDNGSEPSLSLDPARWAGVLSLSAPHRQHRRIITRERSRGQFAQRLHRQHRPERNTPRRTRFFEQPAEVQGK